MSTTVYIEGREPIECDSMADAYEWAALAHSLRLFCVCRRGPKVLFVRRSSPADEAFLDWAETQVEVGS